MTQYTSNNKYKKLLTVIPLACMLSTSMIAVTTFTPTTTHAAASTVQASTIQGYLFKNGVKTPVYTNSSIINRDAQQNGAPYPQLSANPNDPVPTEGSSLTETGNFGNVLYFKKLNDVSNAYGEKLSNGNIVFGDYNPATLERLNVKATIKPGDPTYSSNNGLFDNKVQRVTKYSKIGSGVSPKNGSYNFSQSVTSGISAAEAIGGSVTLGYKLSVKAGGGVLPAEVTNEFSSQLTASFNHTITVSSQITNTQTLGMSKASDSYQYDKYAAAVYQLNSTYTMQPGPNLSDRIQQNIIQMDQKAFQYNDSTLYLAVTPGAGS